MANVTTTARSCACCSMEEDGILLGPHRNLGHHLHHTLPEVFHQDVLSKEIKPKKLAVSCGAGQLTFQELDHFSTAVAMAIENRLGSSFVVTNPDEELLIGVCLPLSEKIVALIFAILKLGAAFLPLDPIYPEDLLLSVIHKFRPVMVITDEDGPILGKYDAKSFAEFCKLLSLEELWMDMSLPPDDDPRWKTGELDRKVQLLSSPKDVEPIHRPAFVVHTTGLSGDPTGVRVGHLAILNRCHWEWHQFSFAKTDACALTVSISSIDGFALIFVSLLKGVTLYMFKRNEMINMTNLIHKFHERKITRLYLYTHSIDSFLRAAKSLGKKSMELEDLKLVCCLGDDIIPISLVHDFTNFFAHVPIIKFFGQPECCGNAIYHRFKSEKDADRAKISDRVLVDHVMDNCCLYILSNYLELTKDGVQGEICVAGESIALGYVGAKDDESVNRFVENPHDERKTFHRLFRTGDYGRIERVGGKRSLYIEGRFDNQVYYRGQHLLMEELEDLILMNDKVEEVETIMYNNVKLDRAVVAFVLPKSQHLHTLMATEVRGSLSNKIPEYLLPEVRIIEKIPPAGLNEARVSQSQLVRIYEQERDPNFENWAKSRLPEASFPACKLLLEAMYKFAGIPCDKSIMSLTSTIYQLGVTSVQALSLLLYLNRRGCHLRLREFIAAKTLNDLIERIVDRMKQKGAEAQKTEVSNNPEGRPRRDSFTQHISFTHLNTENEYETKVLENDVKKDVIDLVSKAYFERGELERYNLVHYNEFSNYFNEIWGHITQSQLSVVVRRMSDRKIVGCSFNQDFFTPTLEMNQYKSLHQYLEYTQELKGSVLHVVPHKKDEVFEIAWIATHLSLSPEETMKVMTLLMKENIRLATIDNFSCVFTLASSRFLQELCQDVLNFELMDEYPANHFQMTEGFHPFRVAPAIVTTCLCWLVVNKLPSRSTSMDPMVLDALKDEDSSTSRIDYRKAAEAIAKGDSLGIRKALTTQHERNSGGSGSGSGSGSGKGSL